MKDLKIKNEIKKNEYIIRKRGSYNYISNNQLLNSSRSISMSNILIKINYTFINKYTEKKLTKNKLERNSNYFQKKNLIFILKRMKQVLLMELDIIMKKKKKLY